jgi:hypothetical protein
VHWEYYQNDEKQINEKNIVFKSPFVVPTTDGKLIEEHHGLAAAPNPAISIAHMVAPPKWRTLSNA